MAGISIMTKNPTLFFRSSESGSLLTLSWEAGQVRKGYNGRIAGRTWPLAERPTNPAAFEIWCRQTFQLGSKWAVRQMNGFEKADIAA